MSFRDLTKAYLAASPQDKAKASITYVTTSGPQLGGDHMAHEATFTLRGTGETEYFRRGDFGERGDAPPGLWRGRCSPGHVKEAWMIFGELTAASYPSRAADPGDTVSRLDGYVPHTFESLAWGPPAPGAEIPGDDFLIFLAPLMNQVLEAQPVWAMEMALKGAAPRSGGLGLDVVFRNPGVSPIGLFLPLPGGRGGFTLRHAVDRDAPPGVTPLPIEWELAPAHLPDRRAESLWLLGPGEEVALELLAPLDLKSGGRYLAKLVYEQTGPLDTLAGMPILSGTCFSEVLEFAI